MEKFEKFHKIDEFWVKYSKYWKQSIIYLRIDDSETKVFSTRRPYACGEIVEICAWRSISPSKRLWVKVGKGDNAPIFDSNTLIDLAEKLKRIKKNKVIDRSNAIFRLI